MICQLIIIILHNPNNNNNNIQRWTRLQTIAGEYGSLENKEDYLDLTTPKPQQQQQQQQPELYTDLAEYQGDQGIYQDVSTKENNSNKIPSTNKSTGAIADNNYDNYADLNRTDVADAARNDVYADLQ